MLMAKWGILRKLNIDVQIASEVIGTTMSIFNFCINHGEPVRRRELSKDDMSNLQSSKAWFSDHDIREKADESCNSRLTVSKNTTKTCQSNRIWWLRTTCYYSPLDSCPFCMNELKSVVGLWNYSSLTK